MNSRVFSSGNTPAAKPSSGATEPGFDSGAFWHLSGEFGINVEGAWSRYSGDGVTIGFVDDAFDLSDPDLSRNHDASLSYDYFNDEADIDGGQTAHGTLVAQFGIGARNGSGSIGVAYDADWAGFAISYGTSVGQSQAMTDGVQKVDILNNSWGYDFSYSSSYYSGSIQLGIESGREGLGTIILFSANNDRQEGLSAGTSGHSTEIGTITVGALNSTGTYASFSNAGSNLLVTAPGANVPYDFSSGTTQNGSGTSFSTPMVSGVVALLLEANPNLGWRDVQEILALTSKTVDEGNSSWSDNGAGNWNGGGMRFSNDYGFGLVDATAAVNLAESWFRQNTSSNLDSAEAIYDPGSQQNVSSHTLAIADDILIDQVTVRIRAEYADWANAAIRLKSADGTVSELVRAEASGGNWVNFTFRSNAFWGESSAGNWTVEFVDSNSGSAINVGLEHVDLKVYGTEDSTNDTYYLTPEFAELVSDDASRSIILDSDGGVDVINLAASHISNQVDLSGTEQSVFEGVNFTISDAGNFEHAVTGRGNDIIWGNALGNTFFTGSGNDRMYGYGGNDYFVTGYGADVIYAGDGDDRIVSQWGGDTIFGEGGADRILTSSGADSIDGGDGDDIIFAGGEDDTAVGGNGNDVIKAGSGNDDVDGSAGHDRIWGEGGVDNLRGGSGDDKIDGGDGNDVLRGEAGSDRLDGGAGADDMFGGDGDDVFILDNVSDQITEVAGQGVDLALVTNAGSYVISDHVEKGRLLNSAGVSDLTMGATDNSLWGNASVNSLNAAAGDDFLDGGAGNDRLTGGSGSDVFIFTDLLGSVDTVTDYEDGTDYFDVTSLLGSAALASATSGGAITGGHVAAVQNGDSVDLYIDAASFGGSAASDVHFATLNGVSVSDLTDADFLF